jgi:hypothetical protein
VTVISSNIEVASKLFTVALELAEENWLEITMISARALPFGWLYPKYHPII